ncbi:MAG: 4Fe-4S binding protein [Clostridia bacterium]|nr:4Fe-4S binding protein [Clostridia bacterium]
MRCGACEDECPKRVLNIR